MTIDISHIHDRLFLLVSKDLAIIMYIILAGLPPDVSEQLHPGMLPEPVDPKTIAPDGRISTADAIYRCYLRDGKSYIYVVLEHKSYQDKATLLQIDRPTERLWSWEMSQNGGKAGDLPQVFGIVFYHGKAPWKGPRNRVEMTRAIPGQDERNPGDDHYGVLDVRRMSSEQIAAYPPLLRSVMTAYALSSDRKATPEQLKYIAEGVDKSELGVYLCIYVRHVLNVAWSDLGEAVGQNAPSGKAVEAHMNYVREAFREEGREETLIDMFLRLAKTKFRTVPEGTEKRVHEASPEQVETWLVRILTADSLDAVFEPAKG